MRTNAGAYAVVPPTVHEPIDLSAPGASLWAMRPAPAVTCWPLGIEVVGDRYAKRMRLVDDGGNAASVLLPLYDREYLLPHRPLNQSLSVSSRRSATHGLESVRLDVVLDPKTLVPIETDPLLEELQMCAAEGERFYAWAAGGTTYFLDSVTLLEARVARDEPMFRLLLSPFREMAAQVRLDSGGSRILLSNVAAFRPRRKTSHWRLARYQAEFALCLTHWLACPQNLSQLEDCADSIRRKRSLHIPAFRRPLRAWISGYQRGAKCLVSGIHFRHEMFLWPCNTRHFTVLDQRAGTGESIELRLRRFGRHLHEDHMDRQLAPEEVRAALMSFRSGVGAEATAGVPVS